MLQISRVIMFGYLAALSVIDWRFRRLPQPFLIMGSFLAVGLTIMTGNAFWKQCLAVFIVGVVFVGVSMITREALGYGDSWVLCILGIYLGVGKLMEVLATVWSLLLIAAVVAFVKSRKSGKFTFPFIPFLLTGYLGMWMTELAGLM